MSNIKVVCINDNDRPNEIPISKWIVKGKIYNIKNVWHIRQRPGTYGVELQEIDLSGCFPYLYFSANRFAPTMQDNEIQEMLENAVKEELVEIKVN